MSLTHAVTVQALLQFALPLGTTLVSGSESARISWSVTIRAQPPALPDVSSGDMVLLAMGMLRAYNSRITLAEVIESLASAGSVTPQASPPCRPILPTVVTFSSALPLPARLLHSPIQPTKP